MLLICVSCHQSPDATLTHSAVITPTNFLIAAPPKGLTAPPKGFTIPPRSFTIPPRGFTLLKGRISIPVSTNRDLFTVPPRALTAPPKGFTVPPAGVSIAPINVTIPPRGFETQQLNEDQLNSNSWKFAVNGTEIPNSRVLIQQVSTSNDLIHMDFMTNGLPKQPHLILSATSPSGLVVLGTYLETTASKSIEINIQETALTLLKISPEGQKKSLKELRDDPRVTEVSTALENALSSPDNFSSSILDNPSVARSLESNKSQSVQSGQDNSHSVVRLEIQPSKVSLKESNQTVFLQASAFNQAEQRLPAQHVIWRVDDPSIATVDQQGIVTAIGQGMTSVYASANGFEGIAVIEVEETLSKTPQLKQLLPTSVKAGQALDISGSGFEAGETHQIVFDGESYSVIASSSRTLQFNVPDDSKAGVYSIYVENRLGRSNVLTLTIEPEVKQTSKKKIAPGDQLVVSGSGFSANASGNLVRFNRIPAVVTSASAHELTVIVPPTVPSGRTILSVTLDGLISNRYILTTL